MPDICYNIFTQSREGTTFRGNKDANGAFGTPISSAARNPVFLFSPPNGCHSEQSEEPCILKCRIYAAIFSRKAAKAQRFAATKTQRVLLALPFRAKREILYFIFLPTACHSEQSEEPCIYSLFTILHSLFPIHYSPFTIHHSPKKTGSSRCLLLYNDRNCIHYRGPHQVRVSVYTRVPLQPSFT